MTTIIGLSLLVIGVGVIAWLLLFKLRPVSYSPEYIQALTEALYEVGYEDQRNGRPEPPWVVEDSHKLNRSHREFLEAAKSVYRHGRQDALEGKPNVVEKIQENREEQLRILKEMAAILREMEITAETLARPN